MTKTGETVEFKYNTDGLRIEKTATSTGTTRYTLHGKNIVHLKNGSEELHFWYDAQNRPAVVEYHGIKYAYVYYPRNIIYGISLRNKQAITYLNAAVDYLMNKAQDELLNLLDGGY